MSSGTELPDQADIPDPAEAPEQARRLGSLLRRQAVDLRPLKIPAYKRLLVGQGTSFVGSMLTQVAVPVQIYELTRSSLYVGFFGLAGLVPIIVFGIYGGAIADVVDRGKLYFWSSLLTWLTTLGLLAQTLLDIGNVWLILALVAVQAGAFAVASSARGAIIPRCTGRRSCRRTRRTRCADARRASSSPSSRVVRGSAICAPGVRRRRRAPRSRGSVVAWRA